MPVPQFPEQRIHPGDRRGVKLQAAGIGKSAVHIADPAKNRRHLCQNIPGAIPVPPVTRHIMGKIRIET